MTVYIKYVLICLFNSENEIDGILDLLGTAFQSIKQLFSFEAAQYSSVWNYKHKTSFFSRAFSLQRN